jgi:hypothetical protein
VQSTNWSSWKIGTWLESENLYDLSSHWSKTIIPQLRSADDVSRDSIQLTFEDGTEGTIDVRDENSGEKSFNPFMTWTCSRIFVLISN